MDTYQLLDDTLDKVGESELLVALLGVPDVFGELGNSFGISLTLKGITLLLEDKAELAVVGDDTVVDDRELVLGVGAVRVGVDRRGLTVGGPAGMSHAAVGGEGAIPLDRRLGLNELLEGSDLSDLLVDQDLPVAIAIDGQTYR